MAVTEMKRLTVICPESDTDKLIKKLMWLCCVDVKHGRHDPEEYDFESLPNIEAQITEKNKLLSRLKSVFSSLARYDTKKWRKISGNSKKRMFSPPRTVDSHEFLESGRYDLAMSKLESVERLLSLRLSLLDELSLLRDERRALEAWENTDLDFSVRHTTYTEIIFGSLGKRANVGAISKELGERLPACIYKVGEDKRSRLVCVIYLSLVESEVESFLSTKGFSKITLNIKSTASEEMKDLDQKISELENKIELTEASIASFTAILPQLEIVYDIISTDISELEAKRSVLKTGGVCVINAWTPTHCAKNVEDCLKKHDVAYEICDPDEGEDVPVLIENNAFATAFEPVISLYSLPKYKTFDPTLVMSFFYMIIFGLMFADVVYGLILAIGCFLAIRLLYPTGTLKKFFMMFALCGLSCMAWGFILGGYLGDFPSTVLGIDANVALWFDPITDPITFLVLSIAVGAIHMITGMVIKMVILIKQKKVFSAIFDVGSWIVIFVGVALALISTKIGLITALVGVLMLILTQGRAQKNIIMKLVKGVGALYNVTSYASDLLSYSRILALGLASAVIAKVVNIIASLGGDGIVGYILLIVVLLVGHALNMAINLLGTFVHASRLQYIEFFGKFYEEGGTPFTPITPRSKYVRFKSKKE